MFRKQAVRFAYTHERALASPLAQAFVTPEGLPPGMRAILDRLDASLAERLDAIRQLTDEEAGHGQGAARSGA